MEGNTESLNVQSTYIKSIPQSKKGRRKSDTLLEKHDRNCPDIFKNTDEEINKEGNLILNNRDEPQINGHNRKEKNNEKLMCEKTDGLVSLESQLNCDKTEKNHVKTILNESAMSPASSTDEEIFQTRFLVQNESLVHENEYFSDTSHTSSKKNSDKDSVEKNDSHTKRKSPIIIQAIACDENKFGVAVLNNLLPSTINEKEINYCQDVIGTVEQSDSFLNVELKNSNFDADSHYMRDSNYNENELLDTGNIKSVTKTLSKEKAKCLTKNDESDWTNLHFDRSNDKLNDPIVDDFFSGTLDVNLYQGVKSLRNRKTTPLSEKKTNKSSNKKRKKALDNKKLLDISNVKNVTKTFPQEKSKSTATKNVSSWSDSHLDKLSDNLDFTSRDFLNDTVDLNSYQAVTSPRNMNTIPLSREKTKNKSFNKEQKNILGDKNDSKEKYDLCNINREKLANGEKDLFESSHTTDSRNVKRKNNRESQMRETKRAKRIQIKQNTDDADKKIEISRKCTFEENANNVQNNKHSALNKDTKKNPSMIKTNNIEKRYKEKMCNEISTNSNIDKYKRHSQNSSKIASEKVKHIEELEQFGVGDEINLDSDNSTKSDTNDISIHKNNVTKLKESSANTKYTYKNNLKSNIFWNKNVLEDISSNKVQSCSANKDKMNSRHKNIVKSLKNTFDKCSKRAKRYDEDISNEISDSSNINKNKRCRRNSSRIASEKIKQIEELEQFDTCEEIDLDSDNGTKSETNNIDIYTNIDTILKDSSAETEYAYEIKNNKKSNSFWNKNVSEDISSNKVQSYSANKDKMNNCHKKIVKSLNKTFDKCSKRDKSYDEDISKEISVNSNIDKNKRCRRNSSRIASEKIKQIQELQQFDTCEEIDLDSDNGTKSETNDIDIYTNLDTILKDSSAETKYAYGIKNNKKSNSFWNKNVSEHISFDKARSCSDKVNKCHKKLVNSLNKTFDKCSKRDKSYDEEISNEISVNSNIEKYKRHRQNSSRNASGKIKQIEELEQFEAYEEIDLGSDNGTKCETNDIDIYANIDTILKDPSAETKYTYEIKNNLKSNRFLNKNVLEDISSDKAQSCSDKKDKTNNCYKRVVTSLNKTFDACSKRDKSYDEDINNEMNKKDRGCIKKDQTVKNIRQIFNKKKIQEDTTENKAIIPFNKTISQTEKRTWDMLEKELLGESENIYTAKNVNRNAIPEIEKTRNQNLQNAERLSLASTAAIQRPINIVERTIAAMGRCTATLFDTKQRINENEKEDSSLFEEVFDNPDISRETQFHSEITFVAKHNKHYYKNEIFGFVKKSTRRKNMNNISENHKNCIYSTCTNNTRNKNNKYVEPSKLEESNYEYCSTKNNSKEKSNTIQAVVLSHPVKQVNPWDRLMNNLQLENDNMQKDFSSNNWKKDSFEPVYNEHLSKYSNHSDEEVANNCDEVNTIDLENKDEEWKLKDFQTLSDTEQGLAENHLTASQNSTLNANNFVFTDSEGDREASTSSINYGRGNIKNQSEKVQSQKEELNKVNKLKKSPQINITDDAEGLKLKEISSISCTTNHSKNLDQLKEKNEIDLSQLKQKNVMEFAQSKQNHEINSNDKTKNKREKYTEYLRKQLNRTQLSHRMKDSHKDLIPMTVENKNNGGISENKLENKRNVKRKLIAENDEDVFSVSSSDSEDDKVKSQCTGIFSDLFDK